MSERCRVCVCVLLAVLVPMAVPATEMTPETTPETGEVACELVEAEWSLSVWGHELGGGLCCLVPDAQRLRLDVAEGAGSRECLSRRGDGWTIAQAGGTDMTLSRWGDEWQVLDVELADVVRILVGVCAGGREGAGRAAVEAGGNPVHASPRELSVVFGGDDERRTLRSELVARGRGRGSMRETLVFQWQSDVETRIRSSRRSGTLIWREVARRPVVVPIPETFLPLWSLIELVPAVETTADNS